MTGTLHAVHLRAITNQPTNNSIQEAWPLSNQNSSLVHQTISCISCKPSPHYSLDRGLPLVIVLTQISTVHTFLLTSLT